ncbi:MAG TPA: hypothetical protein VF997_10740, partial [Polyangia bacterium]
MNISLPTTRHLVFAACAAIVTIGCGGGGGGSATPTPSAAAGTTDPGAGGNGASGTTGSGASPTAGASSPPAAPHAQHKRCGWIGADTFDAGKKAFLANPDYFDAIHPKWGSLQPDGSIKLIAPMADDADITSTAKSHSIKLIP